MNALALAAKVSAMSSSTQRAALPPGHPADAADAVDDRVVVAVAASALELEQLGILAPGRLGADFFAIAHLDRIGGIESDDAMVLHIDARHAVAGRGHDEGVVEADLERPGLDLAVPIRPAFCRRGRDATCRRRPWRSRPA